MIQRLLTVRLRMQIEHNGLGVVLNGGNLPHRDHHILVKSGIGRIARIINHILIFVPRVDSKRYRSIVWPLSLRIGSDKQRITQYLRSGCGMRFPFQSVDILGNDWIERYCTAISNCQHCLCLLLEIWNGDIWPQRFLPYHGLCHISISAGNHGAKCLGSVIFDINSILEALCNHGNGVEILLFKVVAFVTRDIEPNKCRNEGGGC